MNKVKSNIRKNFTIAPNALINDDRLSRDARFLFIWMASKPDNWDFYHSTTANQIKCKEETLRKYIKELISSGWLSRERLRTDNAKFSHFVYTLHHEPVADFSTMESFHNGKKGSLYNKDSLQTNTLKEKRAQINDVLTYYMEVSGRNVYATGKHTKYMTDLLVEGYTVEQMKKVIDYKKAECSQNTNSTKYFEPVVMFKPDNFVRFLNDANAPKPRKSSGKNSGKRINTNTKDWNEIKSL